MITTIWTVLKTPVVYKSILAFVAGLVVRPTSRFAVKRTTNVYHYLQEKRAEAKIRRDTELGPEPGSELVSEEGIA